LEVAPVAQIYDAPIVGRHLFVSLGTVLEDDSGANQTVMNLSEVFGEIFKRAGDLAALIALASPFAHGRSREI
jgi:hypothetical protein